MIEAVCPVGSHPFTYEARSKGGRRRIYCSPEHAQQGWLDNRATKPTRRCSRCKQDKPQEEFAGKAASYCHTCFSEYKTERTVNVCEYPGCVEPKARGRGARFCAEHRDIAAQEKIARAADRHRVQECQWPECTEPKLRGYGHRYCDTHAYPPDLSKLSANVMARRRGMTQDEYDAKVSAQGGLCALCGKPPGKRQLSADHDHKCCPGVKSCGKCQRDLLCDRCNPLLGYAQDDTGILELAIAYLRKWEAAE